MYHSCVLLRCWLRAWYSCMAIARLNSRGYSGRVYKFIRGPRTKTSYASWFLGKPAVQSS
jgi:hypothetical protein